MIHTHRTHFLLGLDGRSGMTACSIYAPWHRGLAYSSNIARVSCRHCLRWYWKSHQTEPKNVTPTDQREIDQ